MTAKAASIRNRSSPISGQFPLFYDNIVSIYARGMSIQKIAGHCASITEGDRAALDGLGKPTHIGRSLKASSGAMP